MQHKKDDLNSNMTVVKLQMTKMPLSISQPEKLESKTPTYLLPLHGRLGKDGEIDPLTFLRFFINDANQKSIKQVCMAWSPNCQSKESN